MERLYNLAIDLGNVDAMNNLAYYYKHITKNYPKMERLYNLSIDFGNIIL